MPRDALNHYKTLLNFAPWYAHARLVPEIPSNLRLTPVNIGLGWTKHLCSLRLTPFLGSLRLTTLSSSSKSSYFIKKIVNQPISENVNVAQIVLSCAMEYLSQIHLCSFLGNSLPDLACANFFLVCSWQPQLVHVISFFIFWLLNLRVALSLFCYHCLALKTQHQQSQV